MYNIIRDFPVYSERSGDLHAPVRIHLQRIGGVDHGLSTMDAEGAAHRDVKYSRFHRCHGSSIALSSDGRTAWRKKGEVCKALVFSEGPVPVGNVFQLKILNGQSMGDLVSCSYIYCYNPFISDDFVILL